MKTYLPETIAIRRKIEVNEGVTSLQWPILDLDPERVMSTQLHLDRNGKKVDMLLIVNLRPLDYMVELDAARSEVEDRLASFKSEGSVVDEPSGYL